MDNRRIGLFLIIAFVIMSLLDILATPNMFDAEVSVLYMIIVRNVTVVCIAGVVILVGLFIYKRIKK